MFTFLIDSLNGYIVILYIGFFKIVSKGIKLNLLRRLQNLILIFLSTCWISSANSNLEIPTASPKASPQAIAEKEIPTHTPSATPVTTHSAVGVKASNHTMKLFTDQKELLTLKLEPHPKDWDIIYDGFGFVSFSQTRGIILEPAAVENPAETQAALILASKTNQRPLRNFTVSVQVSTENQLRKVNPNPWEVFWLFFNYNIAPEGTKETNYFVYKPTGIELGIAFGQTGQKFLATANSPTLSLGKINTLVLTKIDKLVHVFIDGNYALTYQATKTKDDLFDTPGSIGLYTEDAKVHIHSIVVQSLDKPA